MKKNFSKNNSGFTLIELLVVISIIALLSSVIMVSVQDARSKSKAAKLMSDMIQIRNALELYKADNNGNYPPIFISTTAAGSLVPKYLPQAPVNPFKSTLPYVMSTEMGPPSAGNYSYCSGKTADLTEYEGGKKFIYVSTNNDQSTKNYFSKYTILNDVLYDGSNGSIAPCVE